VSEEKRLCVLCQVTMVRASNPHGICQANSRCKRAGERARKQAEFERGRYYCLSCGAKIKPNTSSPHATYTCGAGECHALGRKLAKMLRALEKTG
jgi:hypothetical protein